MLQPRDIALDIDADAIPHVQGDINKAPFQSRAFSEVYFQKVPYDAFSGLNIGAIGEAARLLEPGGRLVIETGNRVPVAQVTEAMRMAGFRRVRVTAKGYVRFTGRLGRST
jgi:SAM-dependent methyltransferase